MRNKLKHGCMTLPEKGGPVGQSQMAMASGHGMAMTPGQEHAHGGHAGEEMHEMGTISTAKALGLIALTLAALLLAAWLTSTFLAPISFSGPP